MMQRRTLISAGLAGLAVSALAGCGKNNADGSATTQFTHRFTGYGGRVLTLPKFPERLVTDSYSFASMWPYGIRPVGLWGYDLDNPENLGGADPTGIEAVGRELEFNVEALAALQPDLLIGFGNADGTAWMWWDEPLADQITQVAPYAGIEFGDRGVVAIIEEYRSLARSLRGQADTPEVRQAETAYADALRRIRDLTARKQLTVLPLYIGQGQAYVGNDLSQLRLLAENGVELKRYPAEQKDAAWSQVSAENLADDNSDLIMSLGIKSTTPLADDPTTKRLPAVAAGQVTTWNDKRPYHYANYAQWLNEFADVYEAAKPV